MIRFTNIMSRGGTLHGSPMEAVEHFMCPGPCDPNCPLYPLKSLADGNTAHMCHPEIVSAFPRDVLDAMCCSYSVRVGNDDAKDTPNQPEALYVAVIDSKAVRDVQVAKTTDPDPLDDAAWVDLAEAEVYLGIFHGPDAMARAAAYGCTDEANIRLIRVDVPAKSGKEAHDGKN